MSSKTMLTLMLRRWKVKNDREKKLGSVAMVRQYSEEGLEKKGRERRTAEVS